MTITSQDCKSYVVISSVVEISQLIKKTRGLDFSATLRFGRNDFTLQVNYYHLRYVILENTQSSISSTIGNLRMLCHFDRSGEILSLQKIKDGFAVLSVTSLAVKKSDSFQLIETSPFR